VAKRSSAWPHAHSESSSKSGFHHERDHSSTTRPQSKPEKPTPDFPLFAHATKRWAKKIHGRMVYFGPWDDPAGALARYLEQREALHSGTSTTCAEPKGFTVCQLAIRFLTLKETDCDAGVLTSRTFKEYGDACKHVIKAFGRGRLVTDLRPDDFEKLRAGWVRRGWGPITIGGNIQRVRTIFKYAYDSALIDHPMRFGPGFCKPNKKTLRVYHAAKGRQMFSRDEILAMLDAAGPRLRAMILLGINCGFGNGDCGNLPLTALDLAAGWVDFPRPKTGIERRCPLWPETVAALKDTVAKRQTPKDPADAGLVFITNKHHAWFKLDRDNPVSKEMRKLLDKIGINGKRNFYCLRRGFETIGGEARDQVAVDFIMGHSRDDMGSLYRQAISDERLRAVVEHVRTWLFGKTPAGRDKKPA
jgi:integrase